MLLARHPFLESFVRADWSALFEIRVTRFQGISQRVPAKR